MSAQSRSRTLSRWVINYFYMKVSQLHFEECGKMQLWGTTTSQLQNITVLFCNSVSWASKASETQIPLPQWNKKKAPRTAKKRIWLSLKTPECPSQWDCPKMVFVMIRQLTLPGQLCKCREFNEFEPITVQRKIFRPPDWVKKAESQHDTKGEDASSASIYVKERKKHLSWSGNWRRGGGGCSLPFALTTLVCAPTDVQLFWRTKPSGWE